MVASETKPVRFGISLPNRAVLFGVSPTLLLETAEAAERSGFFDSAWVGDNLLSKPRLESIVTLSARLCDRPVRRRRIAFVLGPSHPPWGSALAARPGQEAPRGPSLRIPAA